MRALGVDIGGTLVKLALLDGGRPEWTAQSAPYTRPTAAELTAAVRGAMAGREVEVEAVGLCVPGVVDDERRRVIRSVNMPGLAGLDLDELVRGAAGAGVRRVELATDAICCASDIWCVRELRGRLLVLSIGAGVGAAVLDHGVPLLVDGMSPGHVGQLDVSLDGEQVIGPDGGAGGLEGYIGAAALAARYGPDLPAAVSGWRGDEIPLRALARALRICHAIYRPQHVCLAGGIGVRLGHVVDRLRQLVCENLTTIAREGWTLSVGDWEYHAACGAARLAGRA